MKSRQRWYRRHQLFNRSIAPVLSSWLFDSSSLTARLKERCGDEFSVRVLSQRWGLLNQEEADAMSVRGQHSALIREVLLCCGDMPLVYARTVIPQSTIQGALRRYANMGSRPLGAMLFADRTMIREPVQVAMLPEDSIAQQYVGPVNHGIDEVWGRRSVFRVSSRPLLVSEYFLPQLFEG